MLGAFFKRFVGLGSSESRRLFGTFQAHVTWRENTCRWVWREGDIAMWANHAMQHYAITDDGDQRRIVRRAPSTDPCTLPSSSISMRRCMTGRRPCARFCSISTVDGSQAR